MMAVNSATRTESNFEYNFLNFVRQMMKTFNYLPLSDKWHKPQTFSSPFLQVSWRTRKFQCQGLSRLSSARLRTRKSRANNLISRSSTCRARIQDLEALDPMIPKIAGNGRNQKIHFPANPGNVKMRWIHCEMQCICWILVYYCRLQILVF